MALNNVVQIYNKYLIQLLTSLKNIDAPSKEHVRSVLKAAGVLAIDHESSEYIVLNTCNLLVDASLLLPGVTLSELLSGTTSGSSISKVFVALLDVLAATYASADGVLATQVLRVIISIQAASPDANDQLSAIFDEEIQARLRVLVEVINDGNNTNNTIDKDDPKDTPDPGNAFMAALAGSSIASIAKEIADDLVDSDLLKDFGTDPSKIDFASLLDPTSKLGGVAKLVSTKLHEQLGNGQLDQSKLMTEVMSMFGKLNSQGTEQNPLLSQVMNMAGKMGPHLSPHVPVSNATGAVHKLRARLHGKAMKR